MIHQSTWIKMEQSNIGKSNMEKINLNENETMFAPQDGKPGYIINGKWYPVNPNELNSPQLQRDLERYVRLRGREKLKSDEEKLKSKSKSNSKPEVELGRDDPFAPPESSNNTNTPDPTPLPTPPTSTTPPTPDPTPLPTPPTSTTPPTSKPKIPTGVAVSPTTGEKTKFERRLPTTAELKAAQKARKDALAAGISRGEAEYRAVKAGVAASKTSTPISTDTATGAATGNFNPRPVPKVDPNKKGPQRIPKVPYSEAYDVVLDYLLSEGHVDTVEEAHYVMLQMTSEHVRDIVEGEGYSNPSIDGNPIPYPKGHPKAGKPVSFNKAETKDMDRYREASKKAGRKIYADEPLPKE